MNQDMTKMPFFSKAKSFPVKFASTPLPAKHSQRKSYTVSKMTSGEKTADMVGSYQVKILRSIDEISEDEWNACALDSAGEGKENPFVLWAFFKALEDSKSAVGSVGWAPSHLSVRNASGALIGVVPLYLKSHSYGEYVFDQSWARAYPHFSRRDSYYPKLQSCVPFTPVTGPRLLARGTTHEEVSAGRRTLAQALVRVCVDSGVSGLHVTFPSKDEWHVLTGAGFVGRVGVQYHWDNAGYGCFDDFLMQLKQSRRKSIRQERNKVRAAGLTIARLRGTEITKAHWDAFYGFYCATVDSKWGIAYLEPAFFSTMGRLLGDKVLLIVAYDQAGTLVAGALNLIGGDTLYGRNWGCLPDARYDALHFELCYYQAIEAALELGLQRVEAGAQGEHKISRGYLPRRTYSAHLLVNPGMRDAVSAALAQERVAMEQTIARLAAEESPFKPAPVPS